MKLSALRLRIMLVASTILLPVATSALASTTHTSKSARESLEIKEPSEDPYAHMARGAKFAGSCEWQKAIEEYTKADILLSRTGLIHPLNLYFARGKAYLWIGSRQLAIQDYSKAIELESQNADTYTARAEVYYKTGDFQKALQDARVAVKLRPDANTYMNRAGCLLGVNSYREAIADCEESIKLNPKIGKVYEIRGAAQYKLGHYKEAVIDCNSAIELLPGNANLFYLRSESLKRIGRTDLAEADHAREKVLNDHLNEDEGTAKLPTEIYNDKQKSNSVDDDHTFRERGKSIELSKTSAASQPIAQATKASPWTYKDGWNGVIPGITKFAEVVKRFGPIRDDGASVPWYQSIQTRHQGNMSIYYLRNGAISVDVTEGNDYIDSIKIFDFAEEQSFPKTLTEAEEKYGQMPFVENNGHNRIFAGKGVSAECYNDGTALSWIAFWVPATK